MKPWKVTTVRTGIKMEIPKGYYGKIEGRSGLAKQGICPIGGIIDSDYRGEIQMLLLNHSDTAVLVKKGMRVAQLCILPHTQTTLKTVSSLSTTQRGCRGFGSTGYGSTSV